MLDSIGPEKASTVKNSASTVAAVWRQLTPQEAEAGLIVADVLALQWWLEERRLGGWVVKTAAAC